ncbi:hypothetical protein [Glaciihabitans sp. UYNi722]|uniref:hypothetical protein n=1 Tax=Glaciihabitans sp. UYNi722 TaxID=3156344 RepID=UPI003396A925
MSKTVQMSSAERSLGSLIPGADRSTVGAASLVQGVYGHRGNLELVVRDSVDGLWVFWFNANLPGDPETDPEVPAGHWSVGLRFARDARYTQAAIFQGVRGPNHLEVLALDDAGTLQSWYWSPEWAFRRRAENPASEVAAFSAAQQDDGALLIDLTERDGTLRLVVAGPNEYPSRTWAPVDRSTDLGATLAELLVPEPSIPPDVQLRTVGIYDIQSGTARSSISTRDGGSTELIWRGTDGGMRHLRLPLHSET